jgi:hypothetical protein
MVCGLESRAGEWHIRRVRYLWSRVDRTPGAAGASLKKSILRPIAIVALIVVAGVIAWRVNVDASRKSTSPEANKIAASNLGSRKSTESSRPLSKPSPSKPMQVSPAPLPGDTTGTVAQAQPDIAAAPLAPAQPTPDVKPIPLGGMPWTFHALHKHGIGGGCEGELRFDGDRLTFTSSEHPLSLARGQIQGLDGDGFKDGRGKNWHFEIQGMTPGQVRGIFARWLRAAGPA